VGEWLVACGNAPVSGGYQWPKNRLCLHLNGEKRNVDLHLHDISRRMVSNIPSALTDLLEIAAYVFAADERSPRGGAAMAALGRDWRRRFRFIIPVRDPNLWSRPDSLVALTDALAFMSEDEFAFEFLQHETPAPLADYLDLGPSRGKQFVSDEVLLFSGGMDSLCGALKELQEHQHKRLLLVSHQSSTKMTTRQKKLATALQKRFPERVLHVPVRAGLAHSASREYTQRTRSFLFAAIAAAVGAGHQRVLLYENGVVSFNLPIAGQVVGARASRTTHPHTLELLARLLGLLLGREFKIENPFIWKTRTEVAECGARSGHADLLGSSVSCSRIRSMEHDRAHCGVCSQCIDRRVAMLAAGLGDWDVSNGYRVDLLTGPLDQADDRTMAESYVRHALELRGLSPPGFVARFANEIARWSRCFPGMEPDEVARCSYDLLQRHAVEVINALEIGIRQHAHALVEQRLPESCLLRVVTTLSNAGLELPQRLATEPAAEPGPSLDHRNFDQTLDIEMEWAGDGQHVAFLGAGTISSPATYSILELLIEPYLRDRQALRSIDKYRFTRSASLARALEKEEESLRRQISRFRRRVSTLFQERCGLTLSADSVIETRNWKGYRLNPRVHLVSGDTVKNADMSLSAIDHVTSRASYSGKSAC
jgi:7-cyano-7-deazaguanine synthase in queuosine biosynthesis